MVMVTGLIRLGHSIYQIGDTYYQNHSARSQLC